MQKFIEEETDLMSDVPKKKPISDNEKKMIIDLEKHLQSVADIEQLAIVAREKEIKRLPIHLRDLFPTGDEMAATAAPLVDRRPDHWDKDVQEPTKPIAISYGGPLEIGENEPKTLAAALLRATETTSDKGVVFVLPDGSEQFRTYPELLDEACRILKGLRQLGLQPKDPVLFQFDKNQNFIPAFWACILGGFLPTPIAAASSYTDMNAGVSKLYNAWTLLDKPIILTDAELLISIQELNKLWETEDIRVASLEHLRKCPPDDQWYEADTDDLALNLLTSGSTGKPKCVQHRHESILSRIQATISFNDFTKDEVSLNWMPLDHVGGIVMYHVLSVYLTCQQIIPKIDSFIANPLSWLNWIDQYKATITWAPNFAFALINDHEEQIKQGDWDLSKMRHILNGGEAIVSKTAQRFLKILEPHALAADSMFPSYGMSETSSGIVFSKLLTPDSHSHGIHILDKSSLTEAIRVVNIDHPNSASFTEVGGPIPGVSIRIVDETNRIITEDKIGRVQVNGPTIMAGYYNNPEANAEVLVGDGWFNTGDLGFLHEGRLTITGREKEVIIINGNNYHNYEIEAFVEEVSGVEITYSAAWGNSDSEKGSDSLVIFFTPTDTDFDFQMHVLKNIRQHIISKIGIQPEYIVPIEKKDFPKTNSGKIQRAELGRRFVNGSYNEILKLIDIYLENDHTLPDWMYQTEWVQKDLPTCLDQDLQGNLLLFADSAGLAHELSSAFTRDARAVFVEIGDKFHRFSDDLYQINPERKEDYESLFDSIAKDLIKLDHVIHLWNYSASSEGIKDVQELRKAQFVGSYSLLFLTQILASQGDHISLTVITTNMQAIDNNESISYEKSTMSGIVKTIPHEYPFIQTKLIDFAADDLIAHSDCIVKELSSISENIIVAYRKGKRLDPLLKKVDLIEERKRDVPFVHGGFYLITGGLGGIGTLIAKYLLQRYQAKLLLIGRTPLPNHDQWELDMELDNNMARRIRNFLELERCAEQGGEVYYQTVDICNLSEMQSVVNQTELGMNIPLTGVIHLAGVLERNLLADQSIEQMERMFEAKVFGTFVLHQLVEKKPESVFIAASSAGTLAADMMLGGYNSANGFIEVFSQYQRYSTAITSYCFSWGQWDELGMGRENVAIKEVLRNRGYMPILEQQGIYSLISGLMCDLPLVYVGLDDTKKEIQKLTGNRLETQRVLFAYFTTSSSSKKPMISELRQRADVFIDQHRPFNKEMQLFFVQLEEFPVLENGETDQRSLESLHNEQFKNEYVGPRTPIETALAELWKKLLGVNKISVVDNFFALGGHSLKAMQLLSLVRDTFGIDIPFQSLFIQPTIAGIGELIEQYRASIPEQSTDSIVRSASGNILPMSYAQKRQWFLYQLEPDNPYYNNTMTLRLKGRVDVETLNRSLQMIVDRHEILRTRFEMMDEDPCQIIEQTINLHIPVVDLSHMIDQQREDTLEGLIKEESNRPFDLSSDPMIRVQWVRLSGEEHILLATMHHIVSDGWSIGIFVSELVTLYRDLLAGQPLSLSELPIQYSDFTLWQNEWISGDVLDHQLRYWKEQFSGDLPILEMPSDFPRPPVQSYKGQTVEWMLDKRITVGVRKLSQENGATLFMTLLSAFSALIYRYSGQEDLIIGSVIANRNRSEIEGLIGFFANTLALRIDASSDPSFEKLIQQVKQTTLGAYDHQDVPFEILVDKLQVRRDLTRQPLFQVLFILQNAPMSVLKMDDLSVALRIEYNDTAKFELAMHVFEEEQGLRIKLEYNTDLFRAATIVRFLNHYEQLLKAVISDSQFQLSEIPLLTNEELKQVLKHFNDTTGDYPKHKTVHQLFEDQVHETPQNIVLVGEFGQLTYRQLNDRANQLARALRQKGVQPNQIVGILVERSLEMMVGILGILKAGGAYLPIDPTYPKERIDYMLMDSQASLLLIQSKFEDQVTSFHGEVIDLCRPELLQGDACDLPEGSQANDLAYVIYTSGSTGQPKGVMIEHSSVVNILIGLDQKYPLLENDAYLLKTNYTFDVSVTELFGWMFHGGRLVILEPGAEKDPQVLLDTIDRHGITHINFVPSMLQLFLMSTKNIKIMNNLKYIFAAGEALPVDLACKLQNVLSDVKLENIYGPTESTIYATAYSVTNVEDMNVPIGKPLPNVRIYILDPQGVPQPIGVPGELYIAGNGVAQGYLNKPELTAEKFVEDPFKSGDMMYRTGDLARWKPDGNIEYLGRMDHQVKIRGYRIETGEIRAQLTRHEVVLDAIVIARKDHYAQSYLSAYIITDQEWTAAEMRKHLSKTLPDYMIPSYFLPIEKIPLTSSGKVDRNALPEPHRIMQNRSEYVPPTDKTEQKLAEIWSDVLGLQRIGLEDHFFELGGHSLKATMLVTRIHRHFEVSVPLREIFRNPTLKQLADYIKGAEGRIYTLIEQTEEKEYYPVSSAQKRLYVINEFEGAQISYNMPQAMQISCHIDIHRMEGVLETLVQRHESLRTSFRMMGGELMQWIHQDVGLSIDHISGDISDLGQIVRGFIRPFDLMKAPLIRVGLVRLATEQHLLLIDMHHIISDGISIQLLMDELIKLYEGEALPELRLQYKDYAVWQNKLLQGDEIKQQEQFWRNIFIDEIPVLQLPTDYPRPSIQRFEGDRIKFEFSPDMTKRLLKLSADQGTTLYMTLLTIYNVLLSKYSGQEDIVVGSLVAGRPHADLEKIVGMFVNTLALRNYPKAELSFDSFLSQVKERVLEAFERQDYPFDQLVEQLNLHRDLSRNPLFDTMFILQNMDQTHALLKDLTITPYEYPFEISKFDLTLAAEEKADRIVFELEYSTNLFNRETIERFALHFVQITAAVIDHPHTPLAGIEMLTEQEKQQLILDFNDTKAEYPSGRTIQGLFEDQAHKNPDKIAVVAGENRLTYQQLNEKANQFARVLWNKGVKTECRIGLMVNRSIEMVVGILGILKAGGAYVPIDPEYPEERIRFILQDSGAELLLTLKPFLERIPVDIEAIDLLDASLYHGVTSDIENLNHSNHLAYVIYTSGSTGTPKGVMVEHRNVVRLVKNTNYIDFSKEGRILQTGAIVFDASTFEIWGSLLNGWGLYLVDDDVILDSTRLKEAIEENQITTMWLTSPLFNQLSQQNIEMFAGLQHLIVGGDVLSPHHINRMRTKYIGLELINGYGPTENTTFSTYSIIDREYEDHIPIGKPIGHSSAYILDRTGHLVPIGTAGELCVGGDGVARGYLNNPELTKQKFVPSPFKTGERLYKTGDLARWRADGTIEYLGRIDQQVKIRGFRIEPGEITQQLLKHDSILEAVVVARKDDQGVSYLCAYVVCEEIWSAASLRKYLADTLPEYMIPSYFVQLDKMPLTVNGKIDHKSLPEPGSRMFTGEEYIAPRNPIERIMTEIWQEVLNLGKLGVYDNFFSLGGDSIKAIQVASKFNNLGFTISVKDILTYQNISQLCIHADPNSGEIHYDQGVIEGRKDFTPIESWFFNLPLKNPHYFHQSVLLDAHKELNLEDLQKAFEMLVEHHDGLRLNYDWDARDFFFNNGHIGPPFGIETFDLSQWTDDEYMKQIEKIVVGVKSSFDITKDLLLKAVLFHYRGKQKLFITAHHLVVDGVSWRIILEDLIRLYQSVQTKSAVSHPNKTASLKDWYMHLIDYSNRNEMMDEKTYWEKVHQVDFKIPQDFSTDDWSVKQQNIVKGKLSCEQTMQLVKEAHYAYNTEINDLLLTALARTLKEWTGSQNLVIQLESHGRHLDNIDTTRTVGWFTSIYPMEINIIDNHIGDQIKSVKEQIRAVPNKGLGYGILKYIKNIFGENESHLLEIRFNYLGQFDSINHNDLFSFSQLSSAKEICESNPMSAKLDINSMIVDGLFQFEISYNSTTYKEESMASLRDRLIRNLIMVINSTIQKTDTEFTPSDFDTADIEQDDLDKLFD
jgi:amino acid adenylation domain-containing protein/non-ribosomal peptide synthase protein (TIGR01720 family)